MEQQSLNFLLGARINFAIVVVILLNQPRLYKCKLSDNITPIHPLLNVHSLLQACDSEEPTMGEHGLETSKEEYTKDGTVDLRGNPVLRSKRGGWTACSFVVGKTYST
jgi:hypothetical protein